MTTPPEIITAARATCQELMALLAEENSGLTKHDVSLMETRLQHKKRLALKLEQLLQDLKKSGSLWKADASQHRQALHLAEEIRHFQDLAHSNVAMLRAAHQIRADLIVSIRDSVESRTPQAQLYNAGGQVNSTSGTARIVAREA